MRKSSIWAGAILVSLLTLALAYAGWRMFQSQRHAGCAVCGRSLHSHAQVIGMVENAGQRFCCPACALADHRQTGQPVKVVELTDYVTEKPLRPEDAFLVVGSSVNHCLRTEPLLDQHKETSRLEFDRCSPSILAFASEQAARDFVGQQGGTLMSFAELEDAFR